MVEIIVPTPMGPKKMILERDYYNINRNIALRLYYEAEDGNIELWSTISTNTNHKLPPNCVAIKDYSEGEGTLDMLIQNGIISEPISYLHSGFVDIPVCRIICKELVK